MAWLSRVNFVSSDTLSFTDVNNLGNDIRAWGDNVNGGGYTLSNVVLSASSGTMATVTGGTGAASTLTIRSTSGAGTTDAIVFQTGSQVEAARITTGGLLGLGAALPSTKLDIRGTSATVNSTVQIVGLGVSSLMLGQDADGGVIRGQGGNSALRFLVGGAGDNAAAAAGTEAMRINSSAYLLIGYTSSNGAFRLQVNSQIFATNSTIATSDGRYKDKIAPLSSGLDIVEKLRPVSFTWKPHQVHNFDEGGQIGFIAQDIEEALADKPYLGSVLKRNEVRLPDGTREEFLGLCDAKLIPVLVRAIQELKARLDALA